MQINSINIALNNNLINSVEISKANFLYAKNSPQKIDKFEKTNLQNSPSFEGLFSKTKKIINFVPAKNLEEAKNFAEKTLGIKYFEIKNLEIANWVNEGLSNLKNYTKAEFPEKILSKNFKNNVFAETSYNEKSITFNENYQTKYFDNYLKILENKVLIKKKNKYYPIDINLANQKEIDKKAISILKEKEKLSGKSSSLKILINIQKRFWKKNMINLQRFIMR